jgi:GTP 3',8-cyclase
MTTLIQENPLKIIQEPKIRVMRKLRVTLLDNCNFRCFYCMPENPKFLSHKELLKPVEIESICSGLVDLGIDHLRITGGEPTLRREFKDILTRLSQLKIKKLSLTTNGYLLEKYLDFLWDVGCRSINISLDSLNGDKFNKITRSKGFDKAYSAILKAKEKGFFVKLNTLVFKGINDNEINDFIKFSSQTGIEVRFLELMKIGQACLSQNKHFISADEMITKIKETEFLISEEVEKDSTSFNFKTDSGARIGFIASESRPFCESCSRLRLTPKGVLRSCLMSEKGVNLRGVDIEKYPLILKQVVAMKPTYRLENIKQDMYQIGG